MEKQCFPSPTRVLENTLEKLEAGFVLDAQGSSCTRRVSALPCPEEQGSPKHTNPPVTTAANVLLLTSAEITS